MLATSFIHSAIVMNPSAENPTRFPLTARAGLLLAAQIALTALLYVVLVKIGFLAAFLHGSVSAIWPPTGFALAAVFLSRYRLWPGIALGALVANALHGVPLAAAAGIAAGNTLEALICAALLHRAGFDPAMQRIRDVLALGVALSSTLLSASIGVAMLCLGGVAAWVDFGELWRIWWLGDLTGGLTLAPAIMIWIGHKRLPTLSRQRLAEALVLCTLMAAIALPIFFGWFDSASTKRAWGYAVFPFIVAAAMRHGQKTTSAALCLFAAIAIIGTAQGYGPFAHATLSGTLLPLQTFIVLLSVTGLLLAAAAAELQRNREEIRQQRNDLEALAAARDASLKLTAAALSNAETANRAKSRFLAAASHDLRQPAQALGLFIATLRTLGQRPQVASADIAHIAERLQTTSDSLGSLLNALLDISRLDASAVEIRKQPVVLQDKLTSLQHIFSELANNKGLAFRVMPTALTADTDPVLLRQILTNLIANAIRYTEHGKVLVGCRRRANAIEIQVWDSGIGIAEDQHELIFEEFYQIDNTARNRELGLGLGLAIVQRCAKLLGAEVKVTSTPGKGSLFSITLPRATPAAASR